METIPEEKIAQSQGDLENQPDLSKEPSTTSASDMGRLRGEATDPVDEVPETELNEDGFFWDTGTGACSVRVALRVRPLIEHEKQNGKIWVETYSEDNQIVIGKERSFTFDKVFGINWPQEPIFEICVKNLVLGWFKGFNATVLAYGQTGSGKTYTMGSGHTIGIQQEQLGIIPRVISFIFDEVEKRKKKAEFIIKCSFLEIYNEEIHDLLDSSCEGGVDRYLNKGKDITIREEKNGNISVYGLQEETVQTSDELASCLDRGSNLRITSSTLMNNWSSRSHAIFTVIIEQHIIEDLYQPGEAGPKPEENEIDEFMTAKFHFVDLAGSERAKKTGATGNTLKEGISINKGLLCLGNVISALTEEKNKALHVPYRDSKLTRILQDSLGGNSRTSMIAWVSPAEFNFDESLNTLKYASRARNIKNKVVVNRDPNSALIAQLRQQLYDLQKDLLGFKHLIIQNNIAIPDDISDATKNLKEPGRLVEGSHVKPQQPAKFGYFGDKETEEENKKLKEELGQKNRKIGQLETEIVALQEQVHDIEFEKCEISREKDILSLKLETLSKIWERKGVNILEEFKILKEEQLKEKAEGEGEGEDEGDEEEIDLADIGSLSIISEYRAKNEQLARDLQDKEKKIKLLQNEWESLLKIGILLLSLRCLT